ncbi:MAG: N-acetylmuramoyl-L-alanine amidase, partial [Paracoccaceae bacterium]
MQAAAGNGDFPSPNCGPRRGGVERPDLVVIHYTAMPST